MRTYKEMLEAELQSVRKYQAKADLAEKLGNPAAYQIFNALVNSSWRAVADLSKLARIEARRRR